MGYGLILTSVTAEISPEALCALVVNDLVCHLPVFDSTQQTPTAAVKRPARKTSTDEDDIETVAVQISLSKKNQRNNESIDGSSRCSSRVSVGRRPSKPPKDLSDYVTGDGIDSISSDIEIPSSDDEDVDDEDKPLSAKKKRKNGAELPELICLSDENDENFDQVVSAVSMGDADTDAFHLPRDCSVAISSQQFLRNFEAYIPKPQVVLTRVPVPQPQPDVSDQGGGKHMDDDVIELTDDSEEENRQPGSTNIMDKIKGLPATTVITHPKVNPKSVLMLKGSIVTAPAAVEVEEVTILSDSDSEDPSKSETQVQLEDGTLFQPDPTPPPPKEGVSPEAKDMWAINSAGTTFEVGVASAKPVPPQTPDSLPPHPAGNEHNNSLEELPEEILDLLAVEGVDLTAPTDISEPVQPLQQPPSSVTGGTMVPATAGATINSKNSKTFMCEICKPGKSFETEFKFNVHLTHFHFERQLSAKFNIPNLRNHTQAITCPICGEVFNNMLNFLINHFKTHGVIQAMYAEEVKKAVDDNCKVCGLFFPTVTALQNHMASKHPQPQDSQVQQPPPQSQPVVSQQERSLPTPASAAVDSREKGLIPPSDRVCRICNKSNLHDFKFHLTAVHFRGVKFDAALKLYYQTISGKTEAPTAKTNEMKRSLLDQLIKKGVENVSTNDSDVAQLEGYDPVSQKLKHPADGRCKLCKTSLPPGCEANSFAQHLYNRHFKSDYMKAVGNSGGNCLICQAHYRNTYELHVHYNFNHGLGLFLYAHALKEARAGQTSAPGPPNQQIEIRESGGVEEWVYVCTLCRKDTSKQVRLVPNIIISVYILFLYMLNESSYKKAQ